MKKDRNSKEEKSGQKTPSKKGSARHGDSSRLQKGDPAQKAKGKATGRK